MELKVGPTFYFAFQGELKFFGIKYDTAKDTHLMPDGVYKIKIKLFDDVDPNIFSFELTNERVQSGLLDF